METGLTRAAPATAEAAAKRIAESQTIAVVLPDAARPEVVAAAFALISGLRALGKVLSILTPPPGPAGGAGTLASLGTLGADDEPLREFIISFDLTRSPIKELKYERADNRLDIILSPNGRIRREDVIFRWGELRYDLTIAVGARSPEALAAALGKAPELIHEKPVLNIDADPSNRRFGDLNFVPPADAPEPPTLAEMTADILAALGVGHDAERATALFASLAAATGEFRPERTSAGAFRLAGELRGAGADPSAGRWLTPPEPRANRIRLAGRAMARSRLEPEHDLLWALLTAEDLSKTATGSAEDIADVLDRLVRAFPAAGRHALLWQDPGDGTVRIRMAERARTLPAAGDAFPSFAAAEEHVRRLLKDDTAVE